MNALVLKSFLKQKAKQLKKIHGLSQNAALDEAAKQLGYGNYKNYLNVLKTYRERSQNIKEILLQSISSEKVLTKKLGLAISHIKKHKMPFPDLIDILKLFKRSKKSITALCELTTVKEELHKFIFDDFHTEKGMDDISMYAPNFVPKEMVLSGLIYEIKGDNLAVEGNYDLKIKFRYEIDENDSHSKDEFYKDRYMFGTFEIEIDRNKKMTVINSDIGVFADGGFHSENVKEF